MAPTNGSLTKSIENFARIRDLEVAEAQIGILHSIGQRLKDWPEFCQLELKEQDESIKFLFQVADSSGPDATSVKKKALEIIFRYLIPNVFHSRNRSFKDRINLILDFLGNPEHITFQDPFHRSLLFFLHISYRLSQDLKTPEIEIDRKGEDAQAFKWLVDKICQALVNARDYDYLEKNIILEAIPALQKFCLGDTIPATLPFGELSEFFEENIVPERRLALKTLCTLQGHKPALENTSLGKITVEMPGTNMIIPTVFTFVPAPANEASGFDHFARLFLPYVVCHAKFQSAAHDETIAVQCKTGDDCLYFSFWASEGVEIDSNRPRLDDHWFVIENHLPLINYNFTTRPRTSRT